jgi:hypothetical protein
MCLYMYAYIHAILGHICKVIWDISESNYRLKSRIYSISFSVYHLPTCKYTWASCVPQFYHPSTITCTKRCTSSSPSQDYQTDVFFRQSQTWQICNLGLLAKSLACAFRAMAKRSTTGHSTAPRPLKSANPASHTYSARWSHMRNGV